MQGYSNGQYTRNRQQIKPSITNQISDKTVNAKLRIFKIRHQNGSPIAGRNSLRLNTHLDNQQTKQTHAARHLNKIMTRLFLTEIRIVSIVNQN